MTVGAGECVFGVRDRDWALCVQVHYRPEMVAEVRDYRSEVEEFQLYAQLSTVLAKQKNEQRERERRSKVG